MTEPRKYDINDPKERERLLHELSGYLAEDKILSRKAFLEDGTDAQGRTFALLALDELRCKRGHELIEASHNEKIIEERVGEWLERRMQVNESCAEGVNLRVCYLEHPELKPHKDG